jgi:hypothetical protein
MKALTIYIVLAVTLQYGAHTQELGDFRWQYRILLLMDPYGQPDCIRQLQELKAHTAGMQERDILLFVFNGKALLDENGNLTPLSTRGVPTPTFEGVILIGKSGRVQLKKNYIIPAQNIFKRIDAIPAGSPE